MTRSAPIDRTISTFLVLHTPVTSAPNDLAICTANVPTPPAEYRVAWLELRDVLADRFDCPRIVDAELCDLGFAQAHLHASDVRRASHEVPVEWIDGGRAHPDQELIV